MIGNVFRKITLSGTAGAGKSTTGKLLAVQLDLPFLSMGNYARQFAKEQFDADINTFQQLCKERPELDAQLEAAFIDACKEHKAAVIDYRLGFHFLPAAFHVFLTVSDDEAARRITEALREREDAGRIQWRNHEMQLRFLKTYSVDFCNTENYQLVIDTDHLSPEQVCAKILSHFLKE